MIMAVTFHIPGALREFTATQSRVKIDTTPATVADALSILWSLYPGIRDRMATEQGQVREHINIFVGSEDIRYTGGLMSPVADGAEISIIPAVSGGLGTETCVFTPEGMSRAFHGMRFGTFLIFLSGFGGRP